MHCGAAKKSIFQKNLFARTDRWVLQKCQYTRYYLQFVYFSSSRAWQLGKAQAQHLFQWMLFEKGQSFKSSRPFRPDLCPVLLVNHWRKISVCISTFFQSFSIAWTFSTSNAASGKSAPIGEREELFTSLLNASSASSRPGNIQVLKMQHLKTYKIHKMPLAKRHARHRGPSLLATENFCAKYCCTAAASLQRFACGSMSAFFANKTGGLKTNAAGEILSCLKNPAPPLVPKLQQSFTAIKRNI